MDPVDQDDCDSPPLPSFRHHPDPLGTGSVIAAEVACVSCEQLRPYTYTGPVYAVQELVDVLCPWCIADGSAAAQFEAKFTDITWSVPDDVSEAPTDEVLHRTPGFSGWQQERWLHHCGDAAAFLGAAGVAELAGLPDALESLRREGRLDGWPADQIERYLAALDKNGQPTAYLFRCLHCGVHLAYSDFT
ncbi:CbrC family protein [Micromonospora chersina]